MSKLRWILAVALCGSMAAMAGGCGSGDSTSATGGGAPTAPALESGVVLMFASLDDDILGEEISTGTSVYFWRAHPGEDHRFKVEFESIGELRGTTVHFGGNVVFDDEHAVFQYGGHSYALSPAVLQGAREQVPGCRRALSQIDVNELMAAAGRKSHSLSALFEGQRETVGRLDFPKGEAAFLGLDEPDACGTAFRAIPKLQDAIEHVKREVARTKTTSEVITTIQKGTLLRRFVTRLHLFPKGGGEEKYDGSVQILLNAPNEVDEFQAPPPGKPIDGIAKLFGPAAVKKVESGAEGFITLVWSALGP